MSKIAWPGMEPILRRVHRVLANWDGTEKFRLPPAERHGHVARRLTIEDVALRAAQQGLVPLRNPLLSNAQASDPQFVAGMLAPLLHGELDGWDSGLRDASPETLSGALDVLFVRAAFHTACLRFSGDEPPCPRDVPDWCQENSGALLRHLCEETIGLRGPQYNVKTLVGECGTSEAQHYHLVNGIRAPGQDAIEGYATGLSNLGSGDHGQIVAALRRNAVLHRLMGDLAGAFGWAHIMSRGMKFSSLVREAQAELLRLDEACDADTRKRLRDAAGGDATPPGGGELLRMLIFIAFEREVDPHWRRILWTGGGSFGIADVLKREPTSADVEHQRAYFLKWAPLHIAMRWKPYRWDPVGVLHEPIAACLNAR